MMMTTTIANNSGQRVVSTSSLLPFTPVRKPINGSNSPNAMTPIKAASRNASAILTRSLWARALRAPAARPEPISDLLDIGPAEQALRQEDERNRQHGKSGDVLVVDRKVSRPEDLDQADQQAADHRARQRTDAAEHRGGEGFHARHEAVGEAHD